MAAQLIDGKAFAAALRERVGGHAAASVARTGRQAGLAVVLVGHDQASEVYVRSKGKAMLAAGMASFDHLLPADCSAAQLLAPIERLHDEDRTSTRLNYST